MKWRDNPRSIRGSITPLMTPFTREGDLDHASLANLVRWQLANGTHGLSIGGSTGEPTAQTAAERISAIKTVIEASGHQVPIVVGTGTSKLDETLELTGAAHELGIDAALVVTPYYARPTQEGLYRWYKTVADEYPSLPILAYNVPSRAAVTIEPETVSRLYRDVENFVGIKETTSNFAEFSEVLHLCGPDLIVWSGIELLCLPLLALGGIGFLSATSNIAPAACAQMYELWESGERDKALEIHFGLHPLVELIFAATNPGPGKWVLERQGVIESGFVRPPLVGPSEPAVAKILSCLDRGANFVTPAGPEFAIGSTHK